jgi:hypothetical protein
MRSLHTNLRALCLFVAVGLLPVVATAQSRVPAVPSMPMSPGPDKAPLDEALELPRYCWGQYFGYDGPEYTIADCGWYMNHLCQAHLAFNRAAKTTSRHTKISQLTYAKGQYEYTMRGMTPDCHLRDEVRRKLLETTLQLELLGQ